MFAAYIKREPVRRRHERLLEYEIGMHDRHIRLPLVLLGVLFCC